MARSLYSKFILGYLIFGLLGFITIATFSSKMTRDYLVRYQADAMYDEANIIASSCSTMYQGKRMDSEEVTSQIRALSKYLKAEIWVVNRQGPDRHQQFRPCGHGEPFLYHRQVLRTV